jgi:septal ring factor EnvC (AmiA/AmiB activator)
MTKLLSVLAASAFALSLNAFAADQKPQDQTQNQTQRPTQDQSANPADQSKQDQEYLAALKKCENQQGDAKQKCVDQAKHKYNRM